MKDSTRDIQGNAIRKDVIIPNGFSYVEGAIENGYVIQDKNGNQFVLIPEGVTLDGVPVKDFWVSRYEISKGIFGSPKSVAGKMPWKKVSYKKAEEAAKSMNGAIISCEEYDRICMWLVETGASRYKNVFDDGGINGNYSKTKYLERTGSHSHWEHNHIFDFFGNGFTWTSEVSKKECGTHVIRGGHYVGTADEGNTPPSYRGSVSNDRGTELITFRIVLRTNDVTKKED